MRIGTEIRERVRSAPPGSFWRVDDVPGPRGAVHSAFHRLAAEGRVVRVRRGLYWKGVDSRYGAGRPAVFDVALAAGGLGAGLVGWAAANLLGLSTQVPAVPEVAVLGNPPTGIEGVRFRTRTNLDRRGLNPREIALLEVLRGWPHHTDGDWTALRRRAIRLVEEGELRPSVFADVVRREPSVRARELTERLLEELSA